MVPEPPTDDPADDELANEYCVRGAPAWGLQAALRADAEDDA